MSESVVVNDFARYAAMIEGILSAGGGFSPVAESPTNVIQVDRGSLFASVLLDPSTEPSPFVDRVLDATPGEIVAIADSTGHHRPAYRGLLVYSLLQSFRILHERLPASRFGRWERSLRAWSEHLESQLSEQEFSSSGPIPASRGATATEAAWIALALSVAGKVFIRDAWTDLSADFFGKLARAQTSSGTLLTPTRSDNPETHWYHELVLLHAAASYAVQAEDRTLAKAVAANSEFHQNETQPDHATMQPWALCAFIWNVQTRPLADQMLHAVQTQHPSGVGGVSRILLADALYNLRLFVG